MLSIQSFTFSPFQENTYLLINEKKEALIFDPGCYGEDEEQEFEFAIERLGVKPIRLLHTHCHLDHIFGSVFVKNRYGLSSEAHRLENANIDRAAAAAMMFGFPTFPTTATDIFLEEGKNIDFGGEELEIRFAPGHSPGHLVFIHHKQKFVIGGDVLFYGGIGRTDLPGGSFEVLEKSIKEQLYTLPDDYVVYPGHGPKTTIGREKLENRFVRA